MGAVGFGRKDPWVVEDVRGLSVRMGCCGRGQRSLWWGTYRGRDHVYED